MSYLTPTRPGQAEIEVRKSRFIGHCLPVQSRQAALDEVARLRAAHPQARHVCWAYLLGDPAGSASAGMDDDGEPSGTAARPLLNLLQKQRVSDALLVVVRYYGGIKLGVGGLTRAYGQSGQAALAATPLAPHVPMVTIRLEAPFALEGKLRHLLRELKGEITEMAFENSGVRLTASLPQAQAATLQRDCAEMNVRCEALQAE